MYAATDPDGRAVAVKVLRPEIAQDAAALARLFAALERVRALASPHVARVLDVVRDPALVVMERLEGVSLARAVDDGAPLAADAARALGVAIARALAEAHAAGLVHADVKPDNVWLTRAGPRLLDFGLAALAPPGATFGTLAWMAPEQARGEPATAASDVYALGATLWFALTGARPFEAPTEAALLVRVEAGGPPPLPPSVPAALAAAIGGAMARAAGDRPTAAALAAALDACR